MNRYDMLSRMKAYSTDWWRVLLRGAIILALGVFLALAALFNPDGMLMNAREFSWLPAGALVIMTLGVLGCLDAAFAKELRYFFLNLQNGILDSVVGTVILFSINGQPSRLSLLLAAFLIIKGIFRIVLIRTARVGERSTFLIGGGISVVLGFLIWNEWPSAEAWFLALCLAAEIGFRGWSMMQFAYWLKKEPASA